jgi:hypothetical protein
VRKFFVVLEIHDPLWEGDKWDMALYLDAMMARRHTFRLEQPDESTVYDSLGDLLADNVLDALAETPTD